MNIQDCIQFTNENPICSLATVDKGEPRVRLVGFWYADETGFYFQSSTVKEFPHQLMANPKAEACFYKQEGALGTMLRISGEVEIVSGQNYVEKAFEDRPFLKNFGLTVEHCPSLFLFRISHGKAHFWTMESNLKPKEYIEF